MNAVYRNMVKIPLKVLCLFHEGLYPHSSEQKQITGSCHFTLTKFEGGNLVTPYEDLPLSYVPDMNGSTFIPAGSTNLFDAITSRISMRKQLLDDWTVIPQVLFVVMTDGADNISRNNIDHVATAVGKARLHGWTCVFLGPNQTALQTGRQMGFAEGNIKPFSTTEMVDTMQTLSAATTVYRTASQTTKNFF